MAYSVQTLVSAVQRRLPEVPVTTLVQLTNQIHRDILAQIPTLRLDTIPVNLTANTQEYAIAEPVFQVMEAYYQTAANTSAQLTAMTLEGLNAMKQTWRTDPAGTPLYFYLTSNQSSGNSEYIGLYPKPDTSTSAGYPILQLNVSELQAQDLILSDTLLVTLHSSQIYVEGVSFLAAAESRPQLAGAYRSEYAAQMKMAKEYVATRSEMVKDTGMGNIRSSYGEM